MGFDLSKILGGAGVGGVAGAVGAKQPTPEKGALAGAGVGAGLGLIFGSPGLGAQIGESISGLFGKADKDRHPGAMPVLDANYYGGQEKKTRKVLRQTWAWIDPKIAAQAGLRIAANDRVNPQSVDQLSWPQIEALQKAPAPAAYEPQYLAAPIPGIPAVPREPGVPAPAIPATIFGMSPAIVVMGALGIAVVAFLALRR